MYMFQILPFAIHFACTEILRRSLRTYMFQEFNGTLRSSSYVVKSCTTSPNYNIACKVMYLRILRTYMFQILPVAIHFACTEILRRSIKLIVRNIPTEHSVQVPTSPNHVLRRQYQLHYMLHARRASDSV